MYMASALFRPNQPRLLPGDACRWLPPPRCSSHCTTFPQRKRQSHLAAARETDLSCTNESLQRQEGNAGMHALPDWQGALVAEAQQQIAAQQGAGLAAAYPLDKTRQLVETAMLAAVVGLAYTLGNLLRVESYLAYVLPLPIVLSALRSGPAPAAKTLTTAVLLLLILMGPVRTITYLLVYGVLSLALGVSWALQLPWLVSVPLGALARISGYLLYIALSSWVTNENLLMLMLSNVYTLLDQLSAALGSTGSPPLTAVAVVLGSLLLANSIMYVALMHVLYVILLNGMGIRLQRMPAFMDRFISGLPTT